jgi:hypothetical protein
MWKNIVERGRPRMTLWLLRIACLVPKATHAPTIFSTYFISTATLVTKTRLSVALYVHCLSYSLLFFCVREKYVCWRVQFGPNFWREVGFPEARFEVINPTDHCPSLEAYIHPDNEVTSHLLWNRRVIAYSQEPATDRYSELKDASLYLAFVSLLSHKRFNTNLMFGPRTRIPPR